MTLRITDSKDLMNSALFKSPYGTIKVGMQATLPGCHEALKILMLAAPPLPP